MLAEQAHLDHIAYLYMAPLRVDLLPPPQDHGRRVVDLGIATMPPQVISDLLQ